MIDFEQILVLHVYPFLARMSLHDPLYEQSSANLIGELRFISAASLYSTRGLLHHVDNTSDCRNKFLILKVADYDIIIIIIIIKMDYSFASLTVV